MLKIENVDVYGWEATIRGLRNPMNSWDKSDSILCPDSRIFDDCRTEVNTKCPRRNWNEAVFCIGKNDMQLMQRLYKGGTEHRKFMRMIMVSMDIIAPLYWWKEFDTYKVGTTANSCSTMHKIHAKELTMDDFSHDHLTFGNALVMEQKIIPILNLARENFLETKDKMWLLQMIQLLPSSYNQRRTVMMNYEVCANILRQRRNHKLDEWHVLCNEILNLPYFEEITGYENNVAD